LLLKQAKSWLLIKIIANKYPDPVRSVDYVKLKEDSIVAELIALNKEFGTPIFIGKNLLLAQAMTKYRKAQS
jgi:hypothetical protein